MIVLIETHEKGSQSQKINDSSLNQPFESNRATELVAWRHAGLVQLQQEVWASEPPAGVHRWVQLLE